MDEKKKEILRKFEMSNKEYDEGQLFHESKADMLGFGVMVLISILVMLFKYFNNQPITDLLGIVLLGEGISDLFRYSKNKRKKMLFIGLFLTIFGLMFIVVYIASVKGLV